MPVSIRFVQEVERLTERPVRIEEDESLQGLAQMRVARGDAPFHYLRYKPTGPTPPDYFVVWQCAIVLRLYAAPPEKRIEFGSDANSRRKMSELLADPRYRPEIRDMGDFVLESLVTQLRSIPVGLRIEDTLLATCSELKELQIHAIKAQLRQNIEAIAAGASGSLPPKIVKASLAMNTAFAAFWARQWNDTTLTLPYRAAGHYPAGLSLLQIYDQLPADPVHDPDLVEAWAVDLGLKGWYARVLHHVND